MAELAGLILGAIALAGPAYQCYSKCEKLFDDVSNHTRAFKSCAGTFFIQKEMFQGECEIMLSSVYSNQVAQAMLKNPADSRWRALREMRHETAIPLKAAVSAVQRSVEEIERKLLQVLEKVNKKENVAEGLLTFREDELVPTMRPTSPTPNLLGSSLGKVTRAKARLQWALRGNSEIKECLKTLTDQNQNFHRLRKQELKLREIRSNVAGQGYYQPPAFIKKPPVCNGAKKLPVSGSSESDQAQEMFAIRESAQRLFQDITSTGGCMCHKMHLRLDVLPQKTAGGEGLARNFRLVMSPGEQNSSLRSIESQDTCVCLLVKATVDRKGKGVDISRVETQKIDISLRIKDGCTDSDQIESLVSQDRPRDEVSLCTMIQQTSATDIKKASQTGYLGILHASDSRKSPYQHALFREDHTFSASARQSLSQMISTKNQLLPRLERMRMAVVLSLSMLHFGSFSTAWFNEHWRSSDVFFFLDEHSQRALQLEPHIVTQFSTNRSNSPVELNSPFRRCVARNSQLFSLAVVLTEIGLGDLLGATSEGKGIPSNDDPITEFLKLQELIKLNKLRWMVGRRYAKVVERCFYCDFGLGEGDFTKREVQLSFHKVVVEELRMCLEIVAMDDEE